MPPTSREVVHTVPLDSIQERLVELLDRDDEKSVSDAVDLMLSQAAFHGASDIHLEPWAEAVSLRYRIDGILQQIAIMPRDFQSKVNARIKVLADMVVYRKDVPQDGRMDAEKTTSGRAMRVSTVPTVKGEKVVIRLLGDTQNLHNIETLGFEPHVIDTIRGIIAGSQGTLLLTGPSSSGKTTTIYAVLREMMQLQRHTTNIVTIEDPVEYTMDRISQIQVNPHVEFTFANALRSILRQDPEVIMVGEIRDLETAQMAIQSGLTGHFVISTIHSGTAAGVFTRLIDMGIEPFLVASSLTGVLAQRLVRLNCPDCTEAIKPDPVLTAPFKVTKKTKFYAGQGCHACQGIGFRGRASIGEMLTVTQTIGEVVLSRPTTARLEALAVEEGMETLAQDGLNKAKRGITTLEELFRVLPNLAGVV